jgi:hypothetical protein
LPKASPGSEELKDGLGLHSCLEVGQARQGHATLRDRHGEEGPAWEQAPDWPRRRLITAFSAAHKSCHHVLHVTPCCSAGAKVAQRKDGPGLDGLLGDMHPADEAKPLSPPRDEGGPHAPHLGGKSCAPQLLQGKGTTEGHPEVAQRLVRRLRWDTVYLGRALLLEFLRGSQRQSNRLGNAGTWAACCSIQVQGLQHLVDTLAVLHQGRTVICKGLGRLHPLNLYWSRRSTLHAGG